MQHLLLHSCPRGLFPSQPSNQSLNIKAAVTSKLCIPYLLILLYFKGWNCDNWWSQDEGVYSVFTSVMLGAQKQSMCMGSVDECLLCLKPLLEGLCLSVLCVRVCVCVSDVIPDAGWNKQR